MHKDEYKDEKNLVEQGFTLVELLIVVVILGILAGIVVFAVGGLTDKADSNACTTEGETFRTAVVAYKADTGNWPAGTGTSGAGSVGATLNGVDLLSTDNPKYDGTTPGWTYDGTGHTVDTSAC